MCFADSVVRAKCNVAGASRPNASQTIRALDIRTIDRHPLASIGSLVLGLRCLWCPGSAPMPKIIGLHALPPAVRVHGSV